MRMDRALLLLAALAISIFPGLSAIAETALMQFNVRVPMSDGTILSTDIYRPKSPGQFPVILVRTPYTKSAQFYLDQGRYWASHDYVYIVQDVRGRGDSQGTFTPFIHESADGSDTIDWAASQIWSTGKIGMLGNSYLGWTQLYAAISFNEHLAAIIPTVAPPDPDRSFPMDGGVFLPAGAAWLVSLDGHINQNLNGLDVSGAYSATPFSEFDHFLGREIDAWQEWVRHPIRDKFWESLAYQSELLKSEIPTLYISGWYDDVLIGSTENFVNMMSRQGAHQPQHLLIGPWAHAVNTTRTLGDIDFGPDALIDLPSLHRRWFDRWLKDIENGVENEPAVRIFVMGLNQWVDESEWPIGRTKYVKYFLHSDGHANGRLGDGRLSIAAPIGPEAFDQYNYDPDAPVPYEDNFDWRQVGGPQDFSTIELRDDVLVYTSSEFEHPQRVCGPLRMHLFASSSAKDTDWTAKILDVHQSGVAQRLNDGIVRARFRNGTDREDLLTPNKIEEYEINAWSTCQQFDVGHRIRLEISSSAFGKYAQNRNVEENPTTATESTVAHQRIYHDLKHASYVLIPFVD